MYKFSLALVIGVAFAFPLLAQSDLTDTKNLHSFSGENAVGAKRSFYADHENKIFFIDFQSLNVNLNAIVVKDEQGKVVLEEKVFDLPVDTIFELDLTQFKSGKYNVELQSFSKVIHQSFTVK